MSTNLTGKQTYSKVLKYLYQNLKNYKLKVLASYSLLASKQLFGRLSEALILKVMVDTISSQSPSADVASQLFTYLLIYIGAQVGLELLNRSALLITDKVAAEVLKNIYTQAYSHITNLSYDYFENNMSGSIVAKIRRLVESCSKLYYGIQFDIFKTSITLFATLAALSYTSIHLGVAMVVFLVIYISSSIFVNLKASKYFELPATYNSKVSGVLNDNITNILTIKTFGKTNQELKGFQKLIHKYGDLVFQKMKVSEFINAFQVFQMICIEFATWVLLINGWQTGSISAGDMVFVQQMLFASFHKLWGLGSTFVNINSNVYDAKEMLEVFEIKSNLDLSNSKSKRFKIQSGSLEISDLNFSYNEEGSVFKNFNLHIPAGQKVGIVGHSGSGKSTLIKLILRLMDPISGSITCDTKDIKNIEPNQYRSQISYVPQDPLLFHRTILENLQYANPKASKEEIIKVAKKAHAHEFISKLPEQYNSLVGERGVKLSGGERQRVAIARAMLEPNKILILDEATSALDSISEKFIQDSFQKLMKGRTTIVIAHRLSTIMQLDRIIVMDKGQIIEDGTHQELLDKKGKYFKLWTHQNNGFLTE